MRLERLKLERFGHFSGTELDFSAPATRLWIVFGENEAGKSTALRAIGDALFGIDARTAYAFRHGYDALRIAAEISGAGGRRLAFRRRKGTKNTLLDMADKALAEAALAPFLGGATRALFDGLFGLDQQGLREGGRDMLTAQGDLGQMLFEAGSHVRGLSALQADLRDQADALFRPNASKRRFNEAINAYQDARKRVEALTVRAEEWRRNADALAEAEADAVAVQERRDEIERQRARAVRIQRLLPLVADFRRAEAEGVALADAPEMPADAEARFNAALQQFVLAADRLARAEADADQARREIGAIEVPLALLGRAADIRGLPERLGAAREQERDLPKRRAERGEAISRLDDLVRRLGLDLSAEQAAAAVPPDTALAELRRSITDHAAIEQAHTEAARRLEEARLDADRIARDLASLPPALETAGLERALDQAKRRGDLLERQQRLARDLEAKRRKLENRLAALPRWTGSLDSLAAAPVPDGATVQRFEADLAQADAALARARERKAEARAALTECEEQLAALEERGPVPTAEAVAEARALRDRGWHLIRRIHLDGQVASEAELAAFPAPDGLAAAYEHAVREADLLADRRENEAARVEQHARLARQRTREAASLDRCGLDLARAEAASEEVQRDWRSVWAPLGIDPLPPREMEGWLAERSRLLEEADALAALTGEAQAFEQQIAEAMESLRAAFAGAVPDVTPEDRLPLLIAQADHVLKDAAERRAGRAELMARQADRARMVKQEELALARAEARCRDWQAAWAVGLGPLRLPATTTPAAAEAALGLWQDIRKESDRLAALNHRIRRMEEDGDAFAAFIRDIVSDAAPDLCDADPATAAKELQTRLRQAEEAAKRKADAGQKLKASRAQAEQAEADRAAARSVLDLLRAQARCDRDEDILPAIRRAERKAAIAQESERLRSAIVAAADGLSLADAMAEAESADPEAVQADIARLTDSNAALVAESQSIGERLNACRAAQAEMEQGRGAAEAAQDMADALADLDECARRWMVLKTAAFLLGQGIDRFREQQQGPLLRRAAELFGMLTRGSFAGLQTTYDMRDQPILLGTKADGAPCPIEGMSEGTRDQLFLALRLAAVELYVGASEPLPFIADDLFVNFDDARTRAGLGALIALGGSTQVLLFTHHRHVVEFAQQCGTDGAVAVRQLAA